MPEGWRFPILMAISVAVLAATIWLIAPRSGRKTVFAVTLTSAIISIGGMVFAKFGANHDWPVAVYYGAPAALTVFLPPVYFRMRFSRALLYVVLAFLSAPAIHFGALYMLGWDNYMPFLATR